MQTKLTLRLDSDLIAAAKRVAAERNTSVSRLVADYFGALERSEPSEHAPPLPPKTRALVGALKGVAENEASYGRYLQRKHS